MIDLRSDTVTKPTPAMLAAMTTAEMGDEQYLEDPTVNELQRRTAALLGQEAALFLPTATMANEIALRAQTTPGSVLLAEERTHVLIYEAGGPAIHSGLVMRGVPAEAGVLAPEQIAAEREVGVVVLENSTEAPAGVSGRSTSFATASPRRASAAPPSTSTALASSTPRSRQASRRPSGPARPTR